MIQYGGGHCDFVDG